MEEVIAILRHYHKDLETMTKEEIQVVAEVVDAFLNDYRHEGWDAEKIGYGE